MRKEYFKVHKYLISKFRYFMNSSVSLNTFVSNAPFLHILKTSENRKVFWCGSGGRERVLGNKWDNRRN